MKKIMYNLSNKKVILTAILINLLCLNNAEAYIGLGPLLPMLGSIIAYIFISIVTILGLVVYPLKIILKKFKKKNSPTSNEKK
tara:strand:- start:1340 stop:1588 length:249 start_codon:yes stop_codon:yes gene_type:complete